MKYKIGTRGSKLALRQAEYVKETLQKEYPKDEFELTIVTTKGDRVLDRPLSKVGGKGIFVKEIQDKLLSDEIQLAVHSLKDMPAEDVEGLTYTKFWKREDTKDALILRDASSLKELKEGAVIGTGSLRRQKQLKRMRPDVKVVDIRGNVDTRINKMYQDKLDGIVLAAAGLKRINMESSITELFSNSDMIPAPGQGTLAIQVRKDNKELIDKINAFSDEKTDNCVKAERSFLLEMGADCHVPIAAHCDVAGDKFKLDVMFGTERKEPVYCSITGANSINLGIKAAKIVRQKIAGKVYLIGAGPGDEGLLTVKADKILKQADCILIDRLVSKEIISNIKDDCEVIYVGKESSNHTMPQIKIQSLMVKKALEYKCVVRLKGGDGYVFGRGGEEGVYLKEKGVPFEVVPGISSALAGLAYAGIPASFRGDTTGIHIMTAHNMKDELTELDFSNLVSKYDTNIFLMGLSNLKPLVDKLMENGMAGDSKIAIISNATTPEQKTVVSTLGQIVKETLNNNISSPALIVTGNVIKYRKDLNFFEEKILFGKSYLVPKIGDGISPITTMLREQGALADEIKLGNIIYKDILIDKEKLKKINWIIFTSKYAIKGFFEQITHNRIDIRALSQVKFAVVGKKTRLELEKYGIYADFMPEKSNGEALFAQLGQIVNKKDCVAYIKGSNAPDKYESALAKECIYEELSVYENQSVNSELTIDFEKYDGIYFSSSSLVERLFGSLSKDIIDAVKTKRIYAMGQMCNKTLLKYGIDNAIIPDNSSYEELVELEVRKWQNTPML